MSLLDWKSPKFCETHFCLVFLSFKNFARTIMIVKDTFIAAKKGFEWKSLFSFRISTSTLLL